jgi:3-hydroxybutyryl-CoA dehydratase
MNDYRWEDLQVGLAHRFVVDITPAMMERFRRDTGDDNPLHVDRDYARAHGFSDVVAYGLLTASFYSTLVGVYLPGRRCLLQGIDVAFHGPVFPGDQLEVHGEISYLNQAYRQAQISAHTTNAAGVKVSKAKIRVGLHE